MEMPLPDNTFPMMTGQGLRPGRDGRHVHHLKVRADQGANDYGDPGWYQQPKGTWPMNGRARLSMPRPPPATPGTAPGAATVRKPEPAPPRVLTPSTDARRLP
jgi:hypothetical protein